MDSPNISIRIRRHESLPCHGFHRTLVHSSTNTSNGQNNNRAFGKASILIGRRLGATKNNPYVGSFRHAPPTSLYSMAASSLPSLSSMKEADFSSLFLSPSFAFAANSPYVGWFRHAPPVFSSQKYLDTNNNKTDSKRKAKTKSQKTSLIVQHKVNPDSLLEVDRWHHQLTSLLLGANKEETEKAPPLLLRQIINGRLLGGSGKDDRRIVGCNSSNDNIIARCNRMYQHNNTSRVPPLRLSSTSEAIHHPGYKNSVLSRLKSWLLFPLIYTGDECYDEYGCYKDNYGSKKTMSGLKLLPSRPKNERSIEIDSDENDYDDDYSSSSSSVDYDHCGKDSVREGLSPEMEREFSTEANLSVSEIAEAYYAHQLLDERRHRSNSDVSTVSQQSGLSPSSLHHTTDYNGEEEARERLDYEITQMDIARMTRNASRHLDVSSILHLPTITYQKRRPTPPSSPNNGRNKQNIPQCEQSYLQVCTPIHEDRSHAITQGSCIVNIKGQGNDKSILSEDGWSFMMVSDMKPSPINNSMGKSSANLIDDGEDNTATGTSSTDDMCVICLEPFREGDRLRVLPCDHSFHVGCIDRWLSGSHSHNECFTSGCPTCKKRPSIQSSSPPSLQVLTLETIHNNDDDISGSLPSWAFANLGSVMAMSSGDILDGIQNSISRSSTVI